MSGDVLLKVNGEYVTQFTPLESTLDSSIDQEITISLQRGDKLVETRVRVQDLHAITPSRYLEIGGGVVHDLSYQLAAGYMVPVGSVYVASAGYMMGLAGIARKCVVESVNNIPTPDLDAFAEAIGGLRDNERVPIVHYALTDINKSRVSIVSVDRRWHSFRMATRNGTFGQPLTE